MKKYAWFIVGAFLLLALCIISYYLQIRELGFYLDDWHFTYIAYTQGSEGLRTYFFYDIRPYSAWVYILAAKFLGVRPVNWHLFVMFLRWIVSVSVWQTLMLIWPRQRTKMIWVAMIFIIHPVFRQQAISVEFTYHWVCYFLFVTSLFLMVLSLRFSRYYWLLTVISVLLGGVCIITIEYFAILEFLRPVIIWVLLKEHKSIKYRLKRTAFLWMPYFLLFLTYIIWRMFFIPLPEIGDRNTPVILYELFSNTLKTLLHLIEVIIQDLIHATVYSWSETINPSSFDFNRPAWIGSWVISFVAAAALYVLFSRIRKNDIQEEKDSSWVRSFLMVGFLATIFGALPGWLIGQQIYNPKSLWSDRFALPVLIGASILAIGLIEVFFQNKKFQTIIFCGLILLGVSNNIRLANEYRWSWTKQNRFYWQLLWRAPGLEPGTAIFAEGDIFNYMGHYPTSYAINFLYPPGEDPSVLNYWFFPLSRGLGGSFEEAKKGMEIFAEHRSSSFTGNSRDGIAIYYLPENGYCLWVLDPLDKMNPEIPDITKEIVEISNLERIKPTSFSSAYPPPGLLMEEPEHTWCYYYQKAELARQMQDWEQILTYWDITEANGFRTNNTIELVPFIEAFANSNEWTRAFEITMDAKTFTEKAYPFLCSIWANIERTTSSSEQSEDILNSIWEELNCN